MGRPCVVCGHARREEIDRELVAGASLRDIAGRFGTSVSGLQRHKADHLPLAVAQVKRDGEARRTETLTRLAREEAARSETSALSVWDELHLVYERMHLLLDACHRWLQDPDDPGRYDIGPRADDVTVTYLEMDGDTPRRKKAKLSALLARLADGGVPVERGETKYADPRELLVKSAGQLTEQTKLLAAVLEKVYGARQVAAFQETVLRVIGEAAPDVRRAIHVALEREQHAPGVLGPGGGAGGRAAPPDAPPR